MFRQRVAERYSMPVEVGGGEGVREKEEEGGGGDEDLRDDDTEGGVGVGSVGADGVEKKNREEEVV